MKKLFLDTNIVIDLLSCREPYYNESAALFSLADRSKVEISISSLTVANTGYILSQQLKTNKVKEILRKLRLVVNVLPLDDKIIGLALNDDTFTDLEDGFQYFTSVVHEQEIIITRNLKDYKTSLIPVMTAQQFLETMK